MTQQLNKDALIQEIEKFKAEALKMHIVKVLMDSYTKASLFDYTILEDEDNRVFWMKAQAAQLWSFWQAAKVSAVPPGFCVTKTRKAAIGNPNVDFSTAPTWAKYWLKDGYSKQYLWSNVRPTLDKHLNAFVFPFHEKTIVAPDFGFNGHWTKSITSRKAIESKLNRTPI